MKVICCSSSYPFWSSEELRTSSEETLEEAVAPTTDTVELHSVPELEGAVSVSLVTAPPPPGAAQVPSALRKLEVPPPEAGVKPEATDVKFAGIVQVPSARRKLVVPPPEGGTVPATDVVKPGRVDHVESPRSQVVPEAVPVASLDVLTGETRVQLVPSPVT